MKTALQGKGRSAGYARDRMKMLKNDMIHTVKKYITIDETEVKIRITQEPPVFHADIPVRSKKEQRTK